MSYKVAVIPGDGIGSEVTQEAVRALQQLSSRPGLSIDFEEYPYSCGYYLEHGVMMPDGALEALDESDAILLGAVGYPGVPDHVSLWGLLIPIRRTFRQYVNLRPVRLLRGLSSPLRDRGPEDIDFLIVRENNEGEYSEIGGRLYDGTDEAIAMQSTVFTQKGVERVLQFAFDQARRRPKQHVTSATKSNGIKHTMPFWDEAVAKFAEHYPDVTTDQYHIDILAAHFVAHPDWFDVVVGSNLFGDILSDLGPAVAGGIGVAPSANLNPTREKPSMFEPVHGSAPDIAGKGIANPIAALWSASMLLDHLGETTPAADLLNAIEAVSGEGKVVTPDLGGTATTRSLTNRVLAELKS
ncbi:tartrate dehydrogenase [Rhodovibrio salinarum]|uniref:D-malate dehydrogenase [decarboxylating] n=1 Tax=Rhodovibrio salinarum TaxID=1087 RepID=A0A934QFQ1_9PROT|nr:tartrate dehydrogenase [Rhodovibrio salinarum]MBK1695640.1 tartrate dehydrogenase [Rhodovibrio salinarum]